MLQTFNKWEDDDSNLGSAPPINQLIDTKQCQIYINLHGLGIDKQICMLYMLDELVDNLKQRVATLLQDHQLPKYWSLTSQEGIIYDENLRLKSTNLKNNSLIMITQTNPKFTIFVKTITGMTMKIYIDLQQTVQYLTELISEKVGIPTTQQKLILGGRQLFTDHTLSHYNIVEGSTLHLILGIRGGCFPHWAPITLSDGSYKPISEIKIGDVVRSYDTQLNLFTNSIVTYTHNQQTNYLVNIQTEKISIICTPNHPILTKEGWKSVEPSFGSKIGRLTLSDSILSENYQYIQISKIQYCGEAVETLVYNLTIQKTHTYIAFQFVVHNVELYIEFENGSKFEFRDINWNWHIGQLKQYLTSEFQISFQQQKLFLVDKELRDDQFCLEIQKFAVLKLRRVEQKKIDSSNIKTFHIIQNKQEFKVDFTKDATLGSVKKLLNSRQSDEIIFLINGKLITEQDQQLQHSERILAIRPEEGSYAINVMTNINEINIINIQHLYDLNDYVEGPRKQYYRQFIDEQIKGIQSEKGEKSQLYCQFELHHLLAIKVWTSIFIHKILNQDLRNRQVHRWKKYMKSLFNGLKLCPYYNGKGYRGLKDFQDKNAYKVNNRLQWEEVTSVSKNEQVAKRFFNSNGMFLEIDVVSAKDITKLSVYDEEEIVLPPFSAFEIQTVNLNVSGMKVRLREIPNPAQQRVLIWVDDNPENNYKYIQSLEQDLLKNNKQISILLCRSTEDTKSLINQYRWLTYLDYQNLRVVSDMVRIENGEPNYYAGVDLLKFFIGVNFKQEILIFCGNVDLAKQNCKEQKLIGNYQITNQKEVLIKFIHFQ